MIGRVRRAIGGSGQWGLERELLVKDETPTQESPHEPTHEPDEILATYSPHESGEIEYYRNLIQAAVDQKGRLGTDEISLAWLRMILAGLEGRRIDVEELWEGVELRGWSQTPTELGFPEFEDAFPRDADGT